MTALYWLLYGLDRTGHALPLWGPWRRFGLLRYAVCQAGYRLSVRLGREDQFV